MAYSPDQNGTNKSPVTQSAPGAEMVCLDNLKYMKGLPAESMQLVVTSPPYKIGKAYEAKSSLEIYIAAQAKLIAECVRLLHPLDTMLYPIFQRHGLKLRNRIVWHFEHGLHCSKRLSGRYETILWFTKGDDYIFNLDPIRVPSKYPGKKYFKGPKAGQFSGNPLGKNPGDVWVFPNVKNNHVEKTPHPCQFPVELIERLVLSLTEKGGNVLDPYMGVGTAIIGAELHGRIGYGCDVVRQYADIAVERLGELKAGTLRTRPMHKPALPYGGHR
ncbi:MAG: site-specific DNA-methyltransferase [Methylocella sp.]